MLYACDLIEDLVWVRRFGRTPILLTRKSKHVYTIWKYVRVCSGQSVTVLSKWEPENGQYNPDRDPHAGEQPSAHNGSSKPAPTDGTAPAPDPEVAPGGIIHDPDLPKNGWVTEPTTPGPIPPRPQSKSSPPFFTPPQYGEITSANAGTDSAGNVIEKRRYWKLRLPVRLGPEPCMMHATYDFWEETWLHSPNGGASRAGSKPFAPPRDETLEFRIPGCDRTAALNQAESKRSFVARRPVGR
jgi:hypothetical protein